MRKVFTLLLTLVCFACKAQTDEFEDVLKPKILALDKGIMAAQRFNDEIAKILVDYKLAFIDEELKPTIRYVYKTEKNETLRMDFRYTLEADRTDTLKKTKKQVVVYQRISGELHAITDIYNFLFNAQLTPDRVMNASTIGSTINYQGSNHQFIFQADDYQPGYWVMTFVR